MISRLTPGTNTTLADVLVFMMRRRTKSHRAYGITLREFFPQSDLDHLAQLQIIGRRHEMGKGDVYWVRPVHPVKLTAYNYERSMGIRKERHARMKEAA